MKKLLVILALIALPVSYSYAGRCSGGANCTACTNCKYCKNCNNGGDCSVCNPDKYNGKKMVVKKPVVKKQQTKKPVNK